MSPNLLSDNRREYQFPDSRYEIRTDVIESELSFCFMFLDLWFVRMATFDMPISVLLDFLLLTVIKSFIIQFELSCADTGMGDITIDSRTRVFKRLLFC